jgi:hypothetical protein
LLVLSILGLSSIFVPLFALSIYCLRWIGDAISSVQKESKLYLMLEVWSYVRRVDALASRDSAALAIWHLVVQYLLLGWPHHKRNKKPEQFYPKF